MLDSMDKQKWDDFWQISDENLYVGTVSRNLLASSMGAATKAWGACLRHQGSM
jgi:hypothetical protein